MKSTDRKQETESAGKTGKRHGRSQAGASLFCLVLTAFASFLRKQAVSKRLLAYSAAFSEYTVVTSFS